MEKKCALFLIVALAALPTISLSCWHSVAGAEGGVATSSNAGRSQAFLNDPATSEFYQYARTCFNQTNGVYGGFLGVVWQGLTHADLQASIHYNQSTPFSVCGVLTQGVDVQSQDTYQYRYKILIRQLLVMGKLSYINDTGWLPFLIAGVGPSFNKSYCFTATVPPALAFTRVYQDNTIKGFTYAVGAGLDCELMEQVRAGVSYRFTNVGKAALGCASIDSTPVAGTLCQNNFNANEFFAHLTFVF